MGKRRRKRSTRKKKPPAAVEEKPPGPPTREEILAEEAAADAAREALLGQGEPGAEPPSSRRRFLARAGNWAVGACALGAAAGSLRLAVPDFFAGPPERFPLGLPSDFKTGTLTWLSDRQLFVLRDGTGFGLRKLGFYDQASIFVTADHGEGMGEHGIYLHGHHLYETHIRIPLLIRAPWLKEKGKYSSAFLQQIDLFPTFCDLAGAEVPKDLRGLSIVGALRDRSSIPIPRYVIAEYKCYGIKRTAIRTRAYKLIYQQRADREVFMKHVKRPELLPSVSFDKDTFQLYHVLKDPHEKTDIWPKLQNKEGQRLLTIIKKEISDAHPSSRVRNVDPDLVEQLRSMGYTW